MTTQDNQREIIIDLLVKDAIEEQDKIILQAMKEAGLEGANMAAVVRNIFPDGSEVWSYCLTPFLKMFPFKLTKIHTKKGIKLMATQEIEVLK